MDALVGRRKKNLSFYPDLVANLGFSATASVAVTLTNALRGQLIAAQTPAAATITVHSAAAVTRDTAAMGKHARIWTSAR